jgi:hypothetical protein
MAARADGDEQDEQSARSDARRTRCVDERVSGDVASELGRVSLAYVQLSPSGTLHCLTFAVRVNTFTGNWRHSHLNSSNWQDRSAPQSCTPLFEFVQYATFSSIVICRTPIHYLFSCAGAFRRGKGSPVQSLNCNP